MDLEPQAVTEGRRRPNALKLFVPGGEPPFRVEIAIGSRVDFHDVGAHTRRGLELRFVRRDEERHAGAVLLQAPHEIREPVLVPLDVEAAFGRPLLPPFGHNADGVWFMAKCDFQHLVRCRHLEVERQTQTPLPAPRYPHP